MLNYDIRCKDRLLCNMLIQNEDVIAAASAGEGRGRGRGGHKAWRQTHSVLPTRQRKFICQIALYCGLHDIHHIRLKDLEWM
jgi:hypothetical protein